MPWIKVGVIRIRAQTIRTLCVPVIPVLVFALTPVANATASSFTWVGNATASSWSSVKNWAGEAAPTGSEPIALDFPRIATCTGTCYKSENDLSGLSVESIGIDDGDEYELEGDAITLGAGGLNASPASEASGSAGDFIGLPIELGASQTWSIAGRSEGVIGENGVILKGGVTGVGKALTIDLGNKPLFGLVGDTEVGPIAINGTSTGAAGGVVLAVGELNATDGSSVSLSHVGFEGNATIGALKASATELAPGERLEASSATLDASSKILFGVAGARNSELVSHGPVELGGSSIQLITSGPTRQSCASLTNGHVYTLVSTTGTLSGSFSNAPQGKKIVAEYPEGCLKIPYYLEVSYHESEATKTVTAKVIETSGFEIPIPENHIPVYTDPQSPWIAETAGSGSASEIAAWEAANKAREEAERQALARKEAEQQALTARETKVSLASTGVTVQNNGIALVKLMCAGSDPCAGKLTLSAQATSKTKGKKQRTITIGTTRFSIVAGRRATVKVKLDAAGRGLLSAAHERLAALLTILKLSPAPEQTQTANVHLALRKKN